MRRDVFQAIADPTRREIISLIARQPLPLNSIAENFEVSRPAISKHIKILTECGIVTIHNRGRERYCEAKLQKLSEVSQWVDHFRVYWNQKLDALGEFLENNPQPPGKEPLQKSLPQKSSPHKSSPQKSPPRKSPSRKNPANKKPASKLTKK